MKYLLPLFLVFFPVSVQAADFNTFLQGVRQEARGKGISESTLSSALSGIAPKSRIIELDRKQPEGKMTFTQYRKNVISNDRIQKGRRLYRENYQLLKQIEERFGVPGQYIIALWGIETSYGANTGGFNVIEALATLAYDGRRGAFFRGELMNALQIIDEGHISAQEMNGSWAGAMGQNQFMPSSFLSFAVDYTGDGNKDIWNTKADVFASTANYLSRSGWKGDERWGREVRVPNSLPESMTGRDNFRGLAVWKGMGVTLPDGAPIPVIAGMKGAIVRPDGATGPAYLVYQNYNVIMKWNKSTYFATSVGLLADAIAS